MLLRRRRSIFAGTTAIALFLAAPVSLLAQEAAPVEAPEAVEASTSDTKSPPAASASDAPAPQAPRAEAEDELPMGDFGGDTGGLEDGAPSDFSELDLGALLDTVVSSTGTKQAIRLAPSVISVISREELERRGVRSLAEAIAILPGLTFINDQTLPNLSVRKIFGGLRGWGRFVKVMVDGQSISFRPNNSNWMGVGLVPFHMIEQIEVLRGPATTMYGADAFLGVINIITRKGGDEPTFSAEARGLLTEGNPGFDAEVSGFWKNERWDVALAGRLTQEDRSGLSISRTFDEQQESLFGEETASDFRSNSSFYGRVSYDAGDAGTVKLSGFLQSLDSSANFQDYSVLRERTEVEQLHGYGRLDWQLELAERLELRSHFTYRGGATRDDEVTDLGSPDSIFRRQIDFQGPSGGAELRWGFIEHGTLIVGADVYSFNQTDPYAIEELTEARGDRSVGELIPQGDDTSSRLTNVGAYIRAYYRIIDGLELTGGARVDQHNLFDTNFTYRAGLVASPLEALSAKLLFGTSIMTPAADQLFSQASLGTGDINGNPDLDVQTARTAEVVLDYTPGNWLFLRVSGFLTDVEEKIEFLRLGLTRTPTNRDRLQTFGAELETRARWSWGQVYAGAFTARGSRERADVVGIPDPADELFTAAPSVSANVGLNLRAPEYYVQGYLEARYRSELSPTRDNLVRSGRDEDYVLPASTQLDVALTSMGLELFGSDETLLQLRVQNILDARPEQPGYNGIDVPSQGRAFFLSVRQSFGAD